MFYSKCFIYSNREISEMHRPIGVKFCTVIRPRPNFMPFQKNF